MAPPGTRAVILNPPNLRTSWGPRTLDAWYCRPAPDHYRCSLFYLPETKSLQILGTFELYPTHCALPTMSENEHTYAVFQELIRLLTKIMQTITTLVARPQSHLGVADNLPWPQHATKKGDGPISKGATTGMSEDSPANRPVHTPMTSTNPTAPHIVRTTPYIHQRHTRQNIPPETAPTMNPPPRMMEQSPHTHQPLITP